MLKVQGTNWWTRVCTILQGIWVSSEIIISGAFVRKSFIKSFSEVVRKTQWKKPAMEPYFYKILCFYALKTPGNQMVQGINCNFPKNRTPLQVFFNFFFKFSQKFLHELLSIVFSMATVNYSWTLLLPSSIVLFNDVKWGCCLDYFHLSFLFLEIKGIFWHEFCTDFYSKLLSIVF